MALYKDYNIEGGSITLNTDGVTFAVHTFDSLWLMGVDGEYLRLTIGEDGQPITSISIPQKEGDRVVSHVDWLARVSG